jgi:hypothetical protein
MSFKVIGAIYGTLVASAVVTAGVHYYGIGTASAKVEAPTEVAAPQTRMFSLVLPFNPLIHPAASNEDRGSQITWYGTRNEVAQAAEEAARITGDAQIMRIAQVERALANNDPQSAVPTPAVARPYVPVTDRRYGLALPNDSKRMRWFSTREEVARTAEADARTTGDPRIVQIALKKRAEADREAALLKELTDGFGGESQRGRDTW